MRYIYLVFLFLFLLTACGTKKEKNEIIINSTQVSTKQITALLTDIQLFESLINTHVFFRNKDEQNLLFQKILDKHNFTRNELDSCLKYLGNNLEQYNQILDSVKFNIEKMEEIDLPFLKERYTIAIDDNKKPFIKSIK